MGKKKVERELTREQKFTPPEVFALMTGLNEWHVRDANGQSFTVVSRGEARTIVERGYVFPNLNKKETVDEHVRNFSVRDGVSWRVVVAVLTLIRRGSLPSCEDSRTWRRSLNGYEPHFQRCAAYAPAERKLSR